MIDGTRAYQLGTLGVASVAALFDWRTGRIPNWLTFGGVAAAVPLHAWVTAQAGPPHEPIEGIKWSLLGALVCAAPLALGWRFGWVAAGDVKLVAAMGAFSGLSLGLEAVFLSLLCAASFLIMRLAWHGTLLRTVGDGVALQVGQALRKNKKKLVSALAEANKSTDPAASATGLRFGPFACAGAAMSLFLHGGFA